MGCIDENEFKGVKFLTILDDSTVMQDSIYMGTKTNLNATMLKTKLGKSEIKKGETMVGRMTQRNKVSFGTVIPQAM